MNTTLLAGDIGTGGILCEGVVRIFTAQGIEVQALQGLNLTVATGEMVALVGASGSGKSTLLGILAGLDAPTAGVARVAGRDLTTMRRPERLAYRRRSDGFVWQQSSRNLLPYLTARENIAMAHAVARVVPKSRRGALGDELFELLEIGDIADRRPAQLSGGQQQRVAIAVALANEPRVLLADEPTGELDEATGAEVLAAMETVNAERGVTTLIVTHDAAITQHVGRTVRIRDGRTSTETLRSTLTGADGETTRVAEEYAVMDRAGRLQLPQEFVSALQLRDRVKVSLEPDHVQVRPSVPATGPAASTPGAASVPDAPSGRPLTRAEARAARAEADSEGGR